MPNSSQNNNKNNEIKAEMLKKRGNEQAAKLYCKTCKKERFPAKRCVCSGGGSGGGNSSGGEEKSDTNGLISTESLQTVLSELTPETTQRDIMADSLAVNALTFEDNIGLCTLTIKADSAILQKIINELDEFKVMNGMTDKDCFIKPEKDASGKMIALVITIPDIKLYKQFIEHLQAKNLLPTPPKSLEDSQKNYQEKDRFHPTPLSMKLTPKISLD